MKILFTSLLIAITLLNAESLQGKDYGSVTVSEVVSIDNGDTFRVNIKEYPDLIGHGIGIRIDGIDTPEIDGKCRKEKDLAGKAKKFTLDKLNAAKKIELRNMKRGDDFRIVADVYVDGESLSDGLIKAHLGVAYDGGTKSKDWCAIENQLAAPADSSTQELSVTIITNGQKYLIDNSEEIRSIIHKELKILVDTKAANVKHKGTAKAEFILRSGRSIGYLTLRKDTDNEVLNDISLEAIKLSYQKFPAPPRQVVVQIEFKYSL